jgi:hypothetical protein
MDSSLSDNIPGDLIYFLEARPAPISCRLFCCRTSILSALDGQIVSGNRAIQIGSILKHFLGTRLELHLLVARFSFSRGVRFGPLDAD